MPRKYEKPTTFHMTALDKEILERCEYNIDLWAAGYFDGQAFPWQRHFYHAPQKDKLLVAGIRSGKSRLISMGFLHRAQYHSHSRMLNTSISSEQAKIVYQNCLEMCSMPRFQHWVEHVQSSPYPLIRLVNGSELWFRSIGYDAELIRGFQFDWINVDEAAYVTRDQAIKTLKGRLLGRNNLAQRELAGIFTMVSAPKGQGCLAERWKKGDPKYLGAELHKYLSLRATVWDNPLLSQDQIRELMADYTESMIRQELLGEFLDNYDAIFPYQLVMDACQGERYEEQLKRLYAEIAHWNALHQDETRTIRSDAGLTEDITHYECEPQAGHRYVNSWDLGKKPTSKGRNAMVGMVYDVTHEPWQQVAFLYKEGMGYVEAKGMIESWDEKYNLRGSAHCQSAIDATGKGDVLQEFMEAERSVEKLEGIVYSGANKPNYIHAGKIALERGLPVFPFIRRQVDQFTNYVLDDKEIAQDIVMAYCQAMWVARSMMSLSDNQKPSLQSQLNQRMHYNPNRTPQVRLNERYVESRLTRRVLRQTTRGNGRRVLHR